MKDMILKTTVLLALIFSLSSCGKSSSKNVGSSKGTAVTTVPPVMPGKPGSKDPAKPQPPVTDQTVRVDLLNLHPDLAAYYESISLEIHLGVVIGTFGSDDAKFGGDIIVHKKKKGGTLSYSYFTSGGSTLEDVKENYWYRNADNKLVWRGVFEGPNGALVLIVDGVYQSGDGSDPYDYMSGSIWFRQWPRVADTGVNSDKCYLKDGRVDCKNPSGPLVRCWDVSLGPYDCRFNVSSDSKNVSIIGNKYSEEPYIKIGTFINLSKDKTFKENY